jgi:hypothetical protein
MTDAPKQEHRDSSGSEATRDPAAERRPAVYQAPRLRYLGSVRELTLGSIGLNFDCGNSCGSAGGACIPGSPPC